MIKRRWILVALLWLALYPAFGAQHDLEPLKKALDRQAKHRSVQVRLRQTKKLPALKEPVINTGQLWLIPGKSFRWQIGDPKASTAVYDGTRVYLLDEKKKTAVDLSPSDRKVKPLLIMLGIGEGASFDSMMEAFNVSGVKNDGTRYVIVLVPKSSKLKRAINHLTLQVNMKNSFLERIEWSQRDGTHALTEFFTPTVNKPLPESIFSIKKEDYTWK
ncbi:MAG: outer membrane lipoprotein carrier protein LolA [Akkermansiaceae bacterium]|nr:outer membrane lipoprotein carrier protein LolA [Akkermansiaceae bacterium]